VRGEERAMAEAEEAALEFTPTWIVAAVCSVIVLISLAAERGLHHLGKVRRLWACRSTYLPSVSIPADAADDGHLMDAADAQEERSEVALRGAPQGQRRYPLLSTDV
jgi:hypothetical protein